METNTLHKVLITGANGFVGQALLKAMLKQNISVVAAVRASGARVNDDSEQIEVGDLSAQQDWTLALGGVESIVHTAARVHVMNDTDSEPLNVFRQINTDATLNLARQAAQAGVKRFIFLSTIKVNGETTQSGFPFCEQINSLPTDPYAVSKWEAERGLIQIARNTGMEVVIIRPPLIYGPGVKGNFATMMKWLKRGVPLPLGAVHNRRSLLALDNLVSFILLCLEHPKAANETFVLADGVDISTTQLLEKIAHAMKKSPRLLPVPVSWMIFVANLLGKQAVAERLFGSLQIDITKAQNKLNWQPPVSMEKQLLNMVD
jgi:nucleoside-diphosphate-sugar epimerase